MWMHARFLGVSRHVITMLSLLCFRLPPPPLDFKVETVRGWSNGDISIPPSGTSKGEGVQNAKNSRNTSFFGKTAVQVGCTGAVVQHGPKSQGRAFETPKDFWICIRINPYINPYKE